MRGFGRYNRNRKKHKRLSLTVTVPGCQLAKSESDRDSASWPEVASVVDRARQLNDMRQHRQSVEAAARILISPVKLKIPAPRP